jgi:hypothetical protein
LNAGFVGYVLNIKKKSEIYYPLIGNSLNRKKVLFNQHTGLKEKENISSSKEKIILQKIGNMD